MAAGQGITRQPTKKTRGRDGGGIGYEARPSGNAGGGAFDRFGADELGGVGRII